jgi:hypothetical protein
MPATLRFKGGLIISLFVVLAGLTLDAAGLFQPGRQQFQQDIRQDFRQGGDLNAPIYAVNRRTGDMTYNRSAAFRDSSYGIYSRYSRGAFDASSPVGRSGGFGPRQGGRPTGVLAADQTRRTSPRSSFSTRPPSHSMYARGYRPSASTPGYRPSAGPTRSASPPRRPGMAAPTYNAPRQNTRVSSSSYRVRP